MKENVEEMNFEVIKMLQHWRRTVSFWGKAGKLRERTNSNRILLIGTPEHGNLGDHAIAKSEMIFLHAHFPNADIIEITGNRFRKYKEEIKRYVHKTDKIIITGGGFLGTLWSGEEKMARDIIRCFPENKIIIFPQTIYFDDTAAGQEVYQESLGIYREHKNLTICTREMRSYELATKKIFPEGNSHCLLVPDIVTYLDEPSSEQKRRGVLLCLRKDKEKHISQIENMQIEQYASRYTNDVRVTDTVLSHGVKVSMRDEKLKRKLGEFNSAKLVITDRLHGMIFAAITGTPCIALDNTSGKVSGVYQWLKHLAYIQFVGSVAEIPDHMDRLIIMQNCEYDNRCLKENLQKLADII